MLFDRVSAGICTAGEAARATAGVGVRGVFGVGGAGARAVPLGARQRHAHGGARRPPRGHSLPHTGARRGHFIPHAEAIRGQSLPHTAPRGRFSPHTGGGTLCHKRGHSGGTCCHARRHAGLPGTKLPTWIDHVGRDASGSVLFWARKFSPTRATPPCHAQRPTSSVEPRGNSAAARAVIMRASALMALDTYPFLSFSLKKCNS